MLIFGLHSTSDDWPGWSMDSNPIHHPSPAKKLKCSFLDYVQLLMISQAGQWTRTPSATPLQPKMWNACFWIKFNFWWSAGLVDGLKPHLPPLSSQKSEMLIFGLCSTSDDRPGWLMDSNPVHHRSPAKKLKCSFLDYVQLLMISQAGHQVHFTICPTPFHYHILILCLNRKLVNFNFKWTYMYIYIWTQTPSATPLQPNKMKCSFLDNVQLLMIGQAGRWTGTPSTTSLQPKIWNAHFRITFNFWWSAGLVDGLEPCPPPLSSQKSEMLIFGLHSPSDDRPGWSMHLNPICHPSLAKKVKCSFLDYVQLLMIGQAGQWTWAPPATPL